MTPDHEVPLFIAGRETAGDAGRTPEIVNPATGRAIGRLAAASPADVDRAVEAAQQAFDSGVWADASIHHRARVLNRFADLFEADIEEFYRLETLNNGRPVGETRAQISRRARRRGQPGQRRGPRGRRRARPAPQDRQDRVHRRHRGREVDRHRRGAELRADHARARRQGRGDRVRRHGHRARGQGRGVRGVHRRRPDLRVRRADPGPALDLRSVPRPVRDQGRGDPGRRSGGSEDPARPGDLGAVA